MRKKELPVRMLVQCAMDALSYSYAPYSGFKVASSLLTADGAVFTGCNIENAAYSPSNCAERTAFFKAISEGVRDFQAICIVNEDANKEHGLCPPCGVCLQVMVEFCDPEAFYVILAKDEEIYEIHLLKDLMPLRFSI